MTADGQQTTREFPSDPSLPGAARATLAAFVVQARSSEARAAAKTLLVAGGEAAAGRVAAAIAGDLKRELLRIPLSTVVSTHGGETEKNLDRVFANASKSGGVLFFDEGDALFGKRTDVKDSHDRYANPLIDGLLQRIEAHADVAILATRGRQNLDDAVLRRLHVVASVDLTD